jgi:hypothetical protein
MKNLKKMFYVLAITGAVLTGCKKEDTEKKEEIPTPTPAPQSVSGAVEGTWTKGSTVNVSGSIYVDKGKSLKIEEGVTVLFDANVQPEFIVKGNLYVMGTAASPVKLTVDESKKAAAPYGSLWGGIICSPDVQELVITNAIIEYGGAATTEESMAVKEGLYKADEPGEHVPAIYMVNPNTKLVFKGNTVNHFAEDVIYIEGGKLLISNNTFYTNGETGGEVINLKSGVIADVAFNLVYSQSTNFLKLSNGGDKQPQTHVVAYNNTVVNVGWRYAKIKGGSVYLEEGVRVDLFNNLFANNRWGIKEDIEDGRDSRSTIDYNYFFGADATSAEQFQPDSANGILSPGTNGILGTTAGDKDPKFVNFPINTGIGKEVAFDASWDFYLQAGSLAIDAGKADFAQLHWKSGITAGGVTYTSPTPANFIGAFGAK